MRKYQNSKKYFGKVRSQAPTTTPVKCIAISLLTVAASLVFVLRGYFSKPSSPGSGGQLQTNTTGFPHLERSDIHLQGWHQELSFPVLDPGTKYPTNEECCLFGEAMQPVDVAYAPNLFFVGTQKGGTTFLSQMLSFHDDFYRGYCPIEGWTRHQAIKEMHFFDMLHINQTLYEKYVSSWNYMKEEWPKGSHVRYEASPAYMRHSYIPCRMRMLLPDAKIVFLLRDPVARAESVYRMNYGLKLGDDKFMDNIVEEITKLAKMGCTFRDPNIKKQWGDCFKCDFQRKER